MDIPRCPNCFMQLRAQDSDIIRLPAEGGSHREQQNCCPFCHSVLSIEVTMAEEVVLAEEDDSLTMSKLRAIEL
jgi:hypothetical protein